MTEPYRPRNAFEGMDFQEKFCVHCKHDENEDCPILLATFLEDVDSPNYPKKWIQDEQGPRCTAFEETA